MAARQGCISQTSHVSSSTQFLPSVEDRTNFLACLAAVLAHRYHYEYVLVDTVHPETFPPIIEECVGDTDSEGVNSAEGIFLEKDTSLKVPTNKNDSAVEANSSKQSSLRSVTTNNDSNQRSNSPQQSFRNRKSSRKRSSSFLSISLEKKIQVQNQRYRKRRHEILLELLKSAGELLSLDDQNAGEFYIPLIDRLLLPPILMTSKPSFDTDTSSTIDDGTIDGNNVDDVGNDEILKQNILQLSLTDAGASETKTTTLDWEELRNDKILDDQVVIEQIVPSTCCEGEEPPIKSEIMFETDESIKVTTEPLQTYNPYSRRDVLNAKLDEVSNLRPAIESLSPGSGTRCLAMFLIRHLIHSKTGYDARVRYCMKTLGVILFLYDSTDDYLDEQEMKMDYAQYAAKKFEALERLIANQLVELSKVAAKTDKFERDRVADENSTLKATNPKPGSRRRSNIIKGLQIGGAAVAAGVLFAVTAGMAAPAIAAGVAVIAGGTAITASAAALLTTHLAVSTIFGVGGGGLAAYKMNRRVSGLTEFVINKEEQGRKIGRCGEKQQSSTSKNNSTTAPKSHDTYKTNIPELFSTVCISGWLNDLKDFQRPWGVTPTKPPIKDRVELLQRFFAIYDHCRIKDAAKLKREYNSKTKKWYDLCNLLRKEYGGDPDHLFPLENGVKSKASLSADQECTFESLFFELGYNVSQPIPLSSEETKGIEANATNQLPQPTENVRPMETFQDIVNESSQQAEDDRSCISTNSVASDSSSNDAQEGSQDMSEDASLSGDVDNDFDADDDNPNSTETKLPKHISTVWDYQTTYGGELYTIRWESRVIKQISDCVKKLALDMAHNTTVGILRLTALSTLVAALMVPTILASATNLIDGPWTLATDRADEAGKELARCLLVSNAGNRPITLIGFSFGARVIYSCLNELARFQQRWEEARVRSPVFQVRNETMPPRVHEYNTSKTVEESQSKLKKVDRNIKTRNEKVSELISSENKSGTRAKTSDVDTSLEMAREPASIVEDVILLGLPNHFDALAWESCRQVVAGRFVNGYSQKDWVLSLMYRVNKVARKPICGTCPVSVSGVENIDLTDILRGHQDYLYKLGPILDRVNHTQPFECNRTMNRSIETNAAGEPFEDRHDNCKKP